MANELAIIENELKDDDVIEVIVNADGKLWVDTASRGMYCTSKIICAQKREIFLRVVASRNGKNITNTAPSLSAKIFEYGARLQGEIPPIVEAPLFTVRKPSRNVIPLRSYIEKNIIPESIATLLQKEYLAHKTIVVSGGTQSGKTRLANAFLDLIKDTPERVYVVEDTPELVCEMKNNVCVLVNDKFGYRDAVKASLRHRPDRIILGEVRDAAALDLLKAWNTGHPGGLATIHANSAASTADRIAQLVEEVVPRCSAELIAEAIDYVIHIEKNPHAPAGRHITSILNYVGYDNVHNKVRAEEIYNLKNFIKKEEV